MALEKTMMNFRVQHLRPCTVGDMVLWPPELYLVVRKKAIATLLQICHFISQTMPYNYERFSIVEVSFPATLISPCCTGNKGSLYDNPSIYTSSE